MTVARFAVSFDAGLAKEVRRASGDEPVSAWLADAARRKLRAEGLLRIVRQSESEHGELSEDEIKATARRQRRRSRR